MVGAGTTFWHRELSNIGDCTIGEHCVIHSHVWIGDGVKIGNRVKIQAFAYIPPGVTIEDDVLIGPHVCFTNDIMNDTGPAWKQASTLICSGAKIGAHATILPDIEIGRCTIIGAGTVVTKNVPEFSVVYGNPARVRRLV
jgi:acetyltransferase-like isoleucine patch superfamily enzyme